MFVLTKEQCNLKTVREIPIGHLYMIRNLDSICRKLTANTTTYIGCAKFVNGRIRLGGKGAKPDGTISELEEEFMDLPAYDLGRIEKPLLRCSVGR